MSGRLLKNSARCTACWLEVVSRSRHHFNAHWCKKEPEPAKEWKDGKIVLVPGEFTYRFAVDGGLDYERRAGEGFTDTSEYEP